jgi:hypothetical protein
MSLFDILNDEKESAKISDKINAKLASEDFWTNDEKTYNSILKEIEKEHESIKMSQEKYHAVFSM